MSRCKVRLIMENCFKAKRRRTHGTELEHCTSQQKIRRPCLAPAKAGRRPGPPWVWSFAFSTIPCSVHSSYSYSLAPLSAVPCSAHSVPRLPLGPVKSLKPSPAAPTRLSTPSGSSFHANAAASAKGLRSVLLLCCASETAACPLQNLRCSFQWL